MDDETKPHDGREFFQGFERGIDAGRRDVLDIISRLLGPGPLGAELLAAVLRELEASESA